VKRKYLQMGHSEKELFADGISIEIHGGDLQMVRIKNNSKDPY
jgi:hypothetical protein